jgi:DNA-binding response OmpR family regulator
MAKILIVDDNDLVRATTRTMLQSAGHEVHETGDGNAAIDYVRKTPPDPREHGADDCVSKPFHRSDLFARVTAALELRNAS